MADRRLLVAAVCVLPCAAAAVSSLPALRADHVPLGPVEPTAEEQAGIYELNLARHDPKAYGRRIRLDLDSVPKAPPLAVSASLTGSARFHAREMLDHGYFAHTSEVSGIGPNQMAVQHGYDVMGSGLATDWGTANFIESIASGFNLIPTYADALELLIVDKGVPSLGHRVHLLAMHPSFADHREIGCGRAASGPDRKYAIHTSYVSKADRFVTGVVYSDANGNNRYDRGEGLGGVTVQAGAFSQTSMSEGGYSIQVPQGSYTVTCQGGAFPGVAQAQVLVGASNVEVDFKSGSVLGEVDFAFQGGGPPTGPEVAAAASATFGTDSLAVDFTATSPSPGVAFEWDFGDGGTAAGASVGHTFLAPGLYPVLLRGTDATGTGADLVLVSVGGAAGAGAETTPPASTELLPKAGKLVAKHAKSGADAVSFKGTLELPAGFAAEGREAVVSVGGATLRFVLDAKGRGKDAQGNKLKLRFPAPGDGSPLPPGTPAKLILVARGDFKLALAGTGLRNATESRTVEVPFALLLVEQPYRGSADFALQSLAGRRSKALLVK